MTAKHTPGPWRLQHGPRWIIDAPGDGFITRDVCRLDASTMAAFAQEANARLIAAAPELLAELGRTTLLLAEFLAELPRVNPEHLALLRANHALIARAGGDL